MGAGWGGYHVKICNKTTVSYHPCLARFFFPMVDNMSEVHTSKSKARDGNILETRFLLCKEKNMASRIYARAVLFIKVYTTTSVPRGTGNEQGQSIQFKKTLEAKWEQVWT